MKKLILSYLLIALLSSCSKETNEQNHLLPNAKETVDNYNSARPPSFQNAKYLIGEIFIREGEVFDDDQKIIYIGVGKEIFTIQTKKSENYSFPKGDVEVVFLEREFIINDLQSSKISFFSIDENLSEYTSKLNLKNKINVIGLGQLHPGPGEGLFLRDLAD